MRKKLEPKDDEEVERVVVTEEEVVKIIRGGVG